MKVLAKKVTICLQPDINKALRRKAIITSESLSHLVNDTLRHELVADDDDLAAFSKKEKGPAVSFNAFLRELKHSGKI